MCLELLEDFGVQHHHRRSNNVIFGLVVDGSVVHQLGLVSFYCTGMTSAVTRAQKRDVTLSVSPFSHDPPTNQPTFSHDAECPLSLFLSPMTVPRLHQSKVKSEDEHAFQQWDPNGEGHHTTTHTEASITNVSEMNDWQKKLTEGSYYGGKEYMESERYRLNPNLRPTLCRNDNAMDENGTVWGYFVCPLYGLGQTDKLDDCCGHKFKQICCDEEAMLAGFDQAQMDVMTAVGVIAVSVIFIGCCLLLYQGCCQRRPGLSSGKIIWVKKPFSKKTRNEHLDSTFPLSSITEADTEITSEQARGIPEIIIGTGNRENQQNYSTTDLGVIRPPNTEKSFDELVSHAPSGSSSKGNLEELPLLTTEASITNP
ncbi:hypothetical protein ScPMuIL_017287 [Solemya velum]